MKNIVVCILNSLLASGIVMHLKKEPQFKVYREDSAKEITKFCLAAKADVLLAEVRELEPNTIEEWSYNIKEIRRQRPGLKAIFVVDENTSPLLAARVTKARSDRLIDAFFYGTVSGEYISAVVSSL